MRNCPDSERGLRARLLDRLLRVSAAVALGPTVAGVLVAIHFGLWSVVVLDIAGWLLLFGLARSRHLPYATRASAMLIVYASVGVGLLAILGPFGVGLIWLLGAPAIAALLFDARAFWITEAVMFAAILVVAALGAGGALPWDRDAAPLSWWLMAAGSVVCVSLFVGLSTLALMESLEGALRDAVTANEAAEREIAVRKQAEAEREALQTQVAFAQKMELVGQLAGGLAHDLNNLLTVVQVEGTLARDVAGDATVVEGLDHLLEATQSASALCDRLLHFARPGFGRREPQRIDERIAHMLPLLRSLAGERVTLVTGLSAPEARITADPVELEQILTNLVANARDAMPGGGRISITTRVAVDDGGPRLLMSVSDGGTGMDEATLRRVFEPFFTTKTGRGTGLGLATVYAIIHSMDGEIDVRSVVGRGSTFVLQLPLSSTPEVHCALQVPRPGLALPRSPVKVLVVEDNPIVRSVVVRVLEASGCTVVAEAGVPAALDRLRRDGVPDLVVTDVLMPGPSGADLAEAVRATLPETPILAMTGWMGDGELAMRLEALDVPILRKPFAPTDLVDAVGALLSRSPVMMLPE